VTSYSWARIASLYARETTSVARLEGDLATAMALAPTARRPALEALASSYVRVSGARRTIDADVGYNWFWQREIEKARERFDATTRLIDTALAASRAGGALPDEILAAHRPQAPPAFVTIARPGPGRHVVTIAIATDITDGAFVERVRAAVEAQWSIDADGESYRVQLDIAALSPEQLYCGAATGAPATPCAPPAHGAPIDLDTHVAKFPSDRAVLTTGASALHVRRGRMLALTPFAVAPRALAHEIGHLLGFPDTYLRGYRDLGADGFQVLEFVPDLSDIMAAPGFGSVQARHFRQLIAAVSR
jgi:hypothetical protein